MLPRHPAGTGPSPVSPACVAVRVTRPASGRAPGALVQATSAWLRAGCFGPAQPIPTSIGTTLFQVAGRRGLAGGAP